MLVAIIVIVVIIVLLASFFTIKKIKQYLNEEKFGITSRLNRINDPHVHAKKNKRHKKDS